MNTREKKGEHMPATPATIESLAQKKANELPYREGRVGPAAAIIGALLVLVGTTLHPSAADPNQPSAAFAEYAASQPWIMIHLVQLAGVVLIMAALVLLARRMARGPAAEWATLGMAGAIATIALYAALQAVDGVALKAMVDSWAATPAPENAAVFQAALAVRRIEIGLSGTSGLLGGLTCALFGIALLLDARVPKWVGVLAIGGGAPMAIAGVVIAFTGFSDLELTVNMVANPLLVLWMIALGIYGLRRPIF
jgi:hypothetical protein